MTFFSIVFGYYGFLIFIRDGVTGSRANGSRATGGQMGAGTNLNRLSLNNETQEHISVARARNGCAVFVPSPQSQNGVICGPEMPPCSPCTTLIEWLAYVFLCAAELKPGTKLDMMIGIKSWPLLRALVNLSS